MARWCFLLAGNGPAGGYPLRIVFFDLFNKDLVLGDDLVIWLSVWNFWLPGWLAGLAGRTGSPGRPVMN